MDGGPSREWLRRERIILWVWWTSFAVLRGTGLYLGNLNNPIATYWGALRIGVQEMYGWGVLSLVALATARRLPLRQHALGRTLALHLLISVVAVAARLVVDVWIVRYVVGQPAFSMSRLFLYRSDTHLFIFLLLLAAAHGVEYLRRFREQELAAARLQTDLAQARLQMLRAQLQPHLVFNALNAVSGLMTHDVSAARQMITRLSDFLRTVVDAPAEEECTVAEELDSVAAYVDVQRLRFPDRLTVEFRVSADVCGQRVPRFILQPLVENAIQHGIGKRVSQSGNITVLGWIEDGVFHLGVTDDGPGEPADRNRERKEGVGLSNVRQRLRWLYGDTGTLTFVSEPAGSAVTISLPVAKGSPAREPAR